ncbi:MAG TPA: hypothetical protein VNN79_23480 [Actinomycetota bacterium]|nr:hypothetical protein [Actinomycetota bacterium]
MRIELRDGQWADLRDRITHGQDKEIKRAGVRVEANREALVEWPTVLLRAFIEAWNVKDVDGNPIDLADPDALDRAPSDIIDVLFPHAVAQQKATTVPNSPTPS